MLYLIGLGLGYEKDITVHGLEVIRKCSKIYLEHYTAVLDVDIKKMNAFYEKEITLADREFVESGDELLSQAEKEDIALLVVGDPFGATTHTDLVLRAVERGIPCEPIHNCSIMNAIGCTGLQLYHFGQTVSIVFFQDNWKPDSFYDKIEQNLNIGLHTLLLLDIKVKEQSIENMARGKLEYEPPRFMTVAQCCQQLLEVIERRNRIWNELQLKQIDILKMDDKEEQKLDLADFEDELPIWIKIQRNSFDAGEPFKPAYKPTDLAVGLARVAQHTHTDPNRRQKIVAGTIKELSSTDMGPPLHTVILPGRLHGLETQFLAQYSLDRKLFLEKYSSAI